MISTSQKLQGISCSFRSDGTSLKKGQLDQWWWQAALLLARKMPGRGPNKTPLMVPNSERIKGEGEGGSPWKAHHMPTGHWRSTRHQRGRGVASAWGRLPDPAQQRHCPRKLPGPGTLQHRHKCPAAVTSVTRPSGCGWTSEMAMYRTITQDLPSAFVFWTGILE